MFPECSICMSLFRQNDTISETPCGHVYHRYCLREVIASSKKCPECKVVVSEDKFSSMYPSIIGEGGAVCSIDGAKRRVNKTKIKTICRSNDGACSDGNDNQDAEANNAHTTEINGQQCVVADHSAVRASCAKEAAYYCTNALKFDSRNMTVYVNSNNGKGPSTSSVTENIQSDSEEQENDVVDSTRGLKSEQSSKVTHYRNMLDLQRSLEITMNQNEDLKAMNQRLEIKVQELESAKSSITNAHDSLRNCQGSQGKSEDLASYKKRVMELEATNEGNLSDVVKDLVSKLKSVKAELKTSTSQVENKDCLENNSEVLEERLKAAYQDQEKEKQETESKLESMSEEVAKLENIKEDLETKLGECNDKVTTLGETKNLTEQVQTLERDLAASKMELLKTVDAMSAYKQQLDISYATRHELDSINQKLEVKVSTLQSKFEAGKIQLETSQNTIHELRNELDRSERTTKELEEKHQRAMTHIEYYKGETSKAINNMKLLNKNKVELEENNQKLQKEVQKLERDLVSTNIHLDSAKREIPSLKESQNWLKHRKSELEASNESLKKQVLELEESLTSARESLTARNYDVSVLKTSVQSLNTQIAETKGLTEAMTRDVMSVITLREELETTRREIVELKHKVDAGNEVNRKLETTNEGLSKNVDELKRSKQELSQRNEKLEALKMDITAERNETKRLNNKVQGHESYLTLVKAELENTKSSLKGLENHINDSSKRAQLLADLRVQLSQNLPIPQ